MRTARVKLHAWYDTATRCSLREIKSARDAIKSREDEVLNYFINHSTNAGAEYLNSKTIINAADEIVSTLESYEE